MGQPTPDQRFKLNQADIDRWTGNVVSFLAPLGVIYFGAIVVTLQAQNHVISIHDLIPSTFTLGAMALYVVNALYDISRKFVAPK